MSDSSESGSVLVRSGRVARGRARVPPSKSYSNRYLNLALVGGEGVLIEHLLEADDTRHFCSALELMGFALLQEESGLRVTAPGKLVEGPISCGSSGTMLRFLTASLCVVPGTWVLDGSQRLQERPLGPLLATLRELGARIQCPAREGFAPLLIEGGSLLGGDAHLDAGESSQYLSAILMAATRAPRGLRLTVDSLTSSPYLEITLDALERFGVQVVHEGGLRSFVIEPGSELRAARVSVEGDYSAAAYPAGAAVVTGGEVVLEGLTQGSPQGDAGFLDLLQKIGATVQWRGEEVVVSAGRLRAVQVALDDMPDQVPTLAALAPFLEGVTEISNVAHLRIKESDRLAALAFELGRLGVPVEERPDGLAIEGCWYDREPPSQPVLVGSHDDHRIAMSMALVGLRRPGVRIADPGVVAKSYPRFWHDLEALLE